MKNIIYGILLMLFGTLIIDIYFYYKQTNFEITVIFITGFIIFLGLIKIVNQLIDKDIK
jgi:hypothetical protein